MSNFRRNKPRRIVRCAMCTPARWRGNHQGRFKEKEEAARRLTDPGNMSVATKPKSPKRNWPRNKMVRSLKARLVHLRAKHAKYAARPGQYGWLMDRVLAEYDKDIKSCERQLVELGELV